MPVDFLSDEQAKRRPFLVRLRMRTNSGVEVPVGQSTGCPRWMKKGRERLGYMAKQHGNWLAMRA